jgi:hypothetical protein
MSSLWLDDEIKETQNEIATKIADIANSLAVDYTINFIALESGDLAIDLKIQHLTFEETRDRYYDILKLGPRMTSYEFKKLEFLKKKFGFK